MSLGPVHTLNLNLGDDVIREARLNAKGFLDYVRRRIARQVNQALGRTVEWWACLEEEKGRPHLHGEIQAGPDEIKLVRKALRLACGEWAAGRRQFQVATKSNPDGDWPSYPLKNAWKARPGMREMLTRLNAGRHYEVSFNGNCLTATNQAKHEASQIYAGSRKIGRSISGPCETRQH